MMWGMMTRRIEEIKKRRKEEIRKERQKGNFYYVLKYSTSCPPPSRFVIKEPIKFLTLTNILYIESST
jgi:hypothetical protein